MYICENLNKEHGGLIVSWLWIWKSWWNPVVHE